MDRAHSMRYTAVLSLTLPNGFRNSAFSVTRPRLASPGIGISGVWPMPSRSASVDCDMVRSAALVQQLNARDRAAAVLQLTIAHGLGDGVHEPLVARVCEYIGRPRRGDAPWADA